MNYKKIHESIHELSILNGSEQAKIYLLDLFPGIILGINYVNIHRITGNADEASSYNTLRINYCFEGRCEVKLKDGRYVYVDNNALCIESHEPQYNFYYPLGFYKGIQIFIHKDIVQDQGLSVLELFGGSPAKIVDKYSNTNKTFINFASEQFDCKATEIMSVWEKNNLSFDSKIHQIRFLLCQLFYYLVCDEAFNKNKVYNTNFISHSQYMIAIDCEEKITRDLSKKNNIEVMAANYKISPSSLKNYFSAVFGCSISEYTQAKRIHKAKELLETTDMSVMQIAASVGYENQSKFSAVFKKHTGHAPLEYKKLYILKRNEEIL